MFVRPTRKSFGLRSKFKSSTSSRKREIRRVLRYCGSPPPNPNKNTSFTLHERISDLNNQIVRKLSQFINCKYFSLICSNLEYGSVIWNRLLSDLIVKIPHTQNRLKRVLALKTNEIVSWITRDRLGFLILNHSRDEERLMLWFGSIN